MADKHAEGTAGMASGVAAGQGSETGKAPVAEGLKHQLSAFGALSGVTPVKKEGAQKTPDASQGNAPEKAAAVAQGRRRPPPPAASSASGGDLLRQISGISENVSKPESEDARGRGAIKDVSFGKDEIRILSPSGRMVSEVFDKLQQDIVAAMHAKETTLLRSFQFLNRAGRERGVAKIEAVLAELTALLNLDSHNPDADARATLELLNNLVRQHDADGNGSISFGEFIGMCGGATSRSALRGSGGIDGSAVAAEVAEALAGKFTTAKQVFKVMNTGRSNEISSDMLVRACEKAGMVLAPEEMEALFPLIDADKSGRLTYDEVTMLMEYGSTTFEANRALAAQEKQRVKEVAVVCKQMQDACSEREAMERLIEASQTVVPRAKLDIDAITALRLPPGVDVGQDDIAPVSELRKALMSQGALTRELASAALSLAPKRVLAEGSLARTQVQGQSGAQEVTLDEHGAAEEGKYTGKVIVLAHPQASNHLEERVVVSHSATRVVGLDSPLVWSPSLQTRFQVLEPAEVSVVGMLLKMQALVQVRRELAALEDAKLDAQQVSSGVANADLAQIVRGLRKVKADSNKAAWDLFNPQRKAVIGIAELAAGIERVGLWLHAHSASVPQELVAATKRPRGSGGKAEQRLKSAESRCYSAIFSYQASASVVQDAHAASAAGEESFLHRLPSYRDLLASTTGDPPGAISSSSSSPLAPFGRSYSSRSSSPASSFRGVRSEGSSGTGSASSMRGNVLGCMCQDQWVCDKCGTWNALGGGADAFAADRARDLKAVEAQAKLEKRAKKDLSALPYITLVCRQVQLGKGLPPITIDYVPITWSWRDVRLELRARAQRGVNLVFEGKSVHDEEGWARCVGELQEDWKKAKELLGQLDVDLNPIVCCNPHCAQPAPEVCPNVGTPWRAGCERQEWCPLATWQLGQMLRNVDDNGDMQIEFKEFVLVFERLWSLSAEQADEEAVSARVRFQGCLFESFLKLKVRQSWRPKWVWLTDSAMAFADDISDHGRPAARAKLSLGPGASVETSEGDLGFLVRSKDPDGKKADVVWEFECSAPRLRQHWLAVINAALTALKQRAQLKQPVRRQPEPTPAPSTPEVTAEAPPTPQTPTTPSTPVPTRLPSSEKKVPTRLPSSEKKVVKKKKKRAEDWADPKSEDMPERLWRVAGPYRGMCGDVHMLHRCFFDSLSRNPLSLMSTKGMVAVIEDSDASCTAVLQLDGAGRVTTLCHRIARYCIYMSRKQGGGPQVGQGSVGSDEKLFSLQASPEFIVNLYDRPFHCKVRLAERGGNAPKAEKHTNAAVAAEHTTSSAFAGTNATSCCLAAHLELQIIGVSKPLVLRLLQDGSAFVTEADLIGGAPRSSKSTAAGEGEHASTLVAYSRSCISMAETVGQKGGEKKGSEQAGVAHGITLLDWDLENKCFHPPVRTEELDQETSLIELVLEWVEVASGRSQTQLSESSKKRLQSESNVNLEKKGLSLKERTALKQYLAALVGVRDAVKQINSTALLCSTFIAIGARQDLIRALHRILQGVGRVRNHNKKNESEKETREEVDIEEVQIIKIDPVLCGPNAILKRHSFKLSDILNECEALSSRVGVLLGPELQEDSEDLEAEQEPKKAGPDSWQGRNMAALSALAKAMRLEHFPASKVPGAITVIKETRQLKDVQLSIEMDDPMQINELTLHFIALRLPLHVRVVFMTIDFYSIPRVRTGPLTLSAVKGDALRSVRSDGLFPVVPDSLSPGVGNNLTITITPEMAGSNRPADFAHYLCSHDLDIDVWDAESCLALGTLRVSKLHRLLRQGQSAVQILATPSFAIDVPLDEPVLSSTSGRESQYDMLGVSASSGEVRPGALIRIVNRGLLVPTPATGENPQGQEVVKSWRSDLPLRLPPMAGSTDSDQKKQGMSAILHARKYSLARDRGKISGGNVVPIEMNALAVAEQHASALRAYRHNPAYQLQGMQEMIQKLSVKDVEIRPGFGQTDFGYTHPIVNPHNQTVVCTAAMTEVDLENVALEMRDDIIKGMRIGGGALEPSRTNESVPQQAQSWLIQPSAQVALTVTLDNRPENWQLGTYKFTIQITLMSPNQLASQYDLRVTVKPLPVVFDRWLRFFVDSKQFERQMDVPVAILQAGALLSVRTFPGAGVRASISDPPKCPKMGHFMVVSTGKSETYTCDASICHAQKSGERWHCAICSSNFCFSCKSRQILCKLSVNMESEAFCELHKPSSNVSKANKLPGWERQNVGIVVVTMSDRDGEIRQRWKVEVLSIHPATTDARRKSVDVQLSSSIQDKILSLHRQFYSSNPQLLPCYRTGALLAPTEELELEEPSPTFELARGFNRPCFVLLVTQKDKYKRLGNAFGEYYCDSQLVVDDAYGVTMACRLLIIEKVLGEVRTSQKPSCSDSQWQRIQESGVQNIKGAAVNFGRRNPTQEDLVELLRLVRQALQEYCNSKRRINSAEDLPKACRDASLDQRPRDDEFFLAASGGNKAPDAAEAAKQQAEISARVLEARTVGFGTVVGVWRVRAPGSAAPIESDEEVEDEEGTQKQRTGPKPAIMVESVYHCWLKPKERDSEGASRRLQAAALEKHVYKGDHSKPLRQHFSVFQRHQELIHKYPDLTADDRPAGPFLEAVMAESRIFLLMSAEGEGKEGFLTRDEALNSLTEVAWSFEWGATGQYGLRCQGLDFDRRQAVNVPPSVSDIVRIGKDAGGVLMSADDYCRARKKAIATFCKVHSWDAIGGVPQLYYGRGMDLEDAHKMRAAAAPKAEGGGGEADEDEGAVVLEASRTDDDQPDPLECVVVTSAPLHLDMEHFDLKDFMLDSKSGAKRSPLSSRRFPHLFRDSCVKDETGAMCIPSYKEAKSIKELGFKAIPPGGQKLKRRRARIFSDDLRRHGWNACEVLDHVLGKDGVWRHKVQFDDGRIEELALDAMSSAVKELVPDPKRPDEDVLINARALVACLVEDLQLVLSSFAEMVKTFNRKYTRTPEAKGFLKATSLPYIFRCAPGAREMMAEMLEPLLKQALQKVLLEDSGGFCKNLGAIELPLSWKDSFPNKFATMHSVRPDTIQELFGSAASAPGVGTGPPMVDHSIDISFGKVQDILVFGPQDLWAPSGARLPGVLVFSEALAVPCSARHLTGWAAEDCVESFVGDHTDVRLMQNFWFNHSLLDKSRFKPVAVPQSAALELSLEDLREANNLFRLIDTDNSKTLETAECSAYLEGVGYLDDEIEAFFAKCDENCDGSISWSEFLLGAATLYKKQDKDDKTREQLGAEPNTLQVAWEDSSSPIDVDIDSGMPWRQVQERTVSAIEASSGKPMVATSTRTAQIFFEYTNIAKARALVDKARLIFDQIDLDQSGELDRKELMSRLRLPKTVGGWGFEEYQVDDFISDADSDRNGSVDRVEFVRAAARFLLADKVHKADDHWLSGLRFEKEHLRLRCRDETEWAAMQRASIFPTREQRRRAIAELRKRLKLPLEDDASESEARSFTASKHAVQKRLKFVRAELDSVRKLVEQDKAEIEKLKDPKTDEDKKKKAALDEAQRERVAKENAICKIIAHLEPELKSWEAKCKQKKQELGAVEDTRRELFKNEQMRVLNSKGEQAIADVCNMCTHGTCAHSMHKGSEEAMQEVVSALYTHLKAKLRDMTEALDKDEHDTDAPGADIRVLPCFKYNLRCLLHSSVKLTTEVPSEWKEVKDKLGEVSWKNVYSGEERLEKPAAVPVLVNTASQRRPSFLRHFKDWKRSGVLLQVSDTTSWREMKQALLPKLLHERLKLVSNEWVTVRSEEEWEEMKAALLLWKTLNTRIVVVREAPRAAKKQQALPAGWQQHNILPKGWARIYDDAAGKFKYVNTSAPAAEPRWEVPLDCLDAIQWPDDSVSSGKDLAADLGPPPDAVEDHSVVVVNWAAQVVAWLPPRKTADVCAVRVRIAADMDGKVPTSCSDLKQRYDIKDGFVPILLMEQTPAGAAKESEGKEALQLPYTVQEGGKLGGFLVKPKLEWKEMQTLLKDKIEPKGKERIFEYIAGGRPTDPLARVRVQAEWDACVHAQMLQLRSQMMAKARDDDDGGVAAVNMQRLRIFVRDHSAVMKLQVLDSLPSNEVNKLPNHGTVLVDATPMQIRAALDVKQTSSFAALASELKSVCKASCVFRYEHPRLVASEAAWLATLERLYSDTSPLGGARDKRSVLRLGNSNSDGASDGEQQPLCAITLVFPELELEVLVDEGTGWLRLLGEVRRVAGGSTAGVMFGGLEVRDEAGYKTLMQRELKEKHAVTNLQTVDKATLTALRAAWKDDPKTGAISLELQRRRTLEDAAGVGQEAAVTGSDTVLKLRLEPCEVVSERGSGRMLMCAHLEGGLRSFRLSCREAKVEELEAVLPDKGAGGASPGKDALNKGSMRDVRKGSMRNVTKGAAAKGVSMRDVTRAPEATLVLEVMRRTRKGKEKINALLLLQERAERIFALSPGDLSGPGHGLRRDVSCCPRAKERGAAAGCCAGLVWDVRETILHSKVALCEDNNVFCYNGPTLAKVRGGTYTLASLSAALWHAVVATGVHPQQDVQGGSRLDFGLTIDQSVLADDWEEMDPAPLPKARGRGGEGGGGKGGAASPPRTYKHRVSGEESDAKSGKPVRLVCTGRGNFTALNAHVLSSLARDCVYWTGSATVTVASEGKALCYSGPRLISLPPGEYSLESLQSTMQKQVEQQQHVASTPDAAASTADANLAVFRFSPANHPTQQDALPPDWQACPYDPLVALEARGPLPPAHCGQPGPVYYVYTPTRHAQWEKPFRRVLLEITCSGFQANFAASSLRGVLGFEPCLCPPALSEAHALARPKPTSSGAGGSKASVAAVAAPGAATRAAGGSGTQERAVGGDGKGLFMAQCAPQIGWGQLKEVLSQVVKGMARIDLEYVPQGVEDSAEGRGEEDKVERVSNNESWQKMLEYMRAKATADPSEPSEVDVDLLLLKSGGRR